MKKKGKLMRVTKILINMIPPKKNLIVAFTIYTLPKKKQRRAQQ